jgi:hypothetical protein
MPKISEMAVITGSGHAGSLAERARAAGDPESDLVTTAWLIHQAMVDQAQRAGRVIVPDAEPPQHEAGEPPAWLELTGSLSATLVELQLASYKDYDSLKSLRKAVSHELWRRGNAVCISSGSPANGISPVWAVREEYREVVLKDPASVPIVAANTHTRGTLPLKSPAFAAGPQLPASPVPASHRDVAKPLEITFGATSARRADGATRVACRWCGRDYAATYLGRHTFQYHVEPAAVLLDAIRNRGTMTRRDLAVLLCAAINGGIVDTNYIARVLDPYVKPPSPVLEFHKGWASDCWYIWKGGNDVPSTAAVQATVNNHHRAEAITATPPPPPPLPAAPSAARELPAGSSAGLTQSTPAPPAAPLPEPSLALPVLELLDAFQRHVATYSHEIRQRVEQLEARAAHAEEKARNAEPDPAVLAELDELRELKDRVHNLLGG